MKPEKQWPYNDTVLARFLSEGCRQHQCRKHFTIKFQEKQIFPAVVSYHISDALRLNIVFHVLVKGLQKIDIRGVVTQSSLRTLNDYYLIITSGF